MVIDTSAIVAILFDEPERASFNEKIATAVTRLIAAPNLVECYIVVESRKHDLGRVELELFVREAQITVVAFDNVVVSLFPG